MKIVVGIPTPPQWDMTSDMEEVGWSQAGVCRSERERERARERTFTLYSITSSTCMYVVQDMNIIAERLSARQLILRRISEIVCVYVIVTR